VSDTRPAWCIAVIRMVRELTHRYADAEGRRRIQLRGGSSLRRVFLIIRQRNKSNLYH